MKALVVLALIGMTVGFGSVDFGFLGGDTRGNSLTVAGGEGGDGKGNGRCAGNERDNGRSVNNC